MRGSIEFNTYWDKNLKKKLKLSLVNCAFKFNTEALKKY